MPKNHVAEGLGLDVGKRNAGRITSSAAEMPQISTPQIPQKAIALAALPASAIDDIYWRRLSILFLFRLPASLSSFVWIEFGNQVSPAPASCGRALLTPRFSGILLVTRLGHWVELWRGYLITQKVAES